jgi:quaternary ammonium compound-resistance protein SugE
LPWIVVRTLAALMLGFALLGLAMRDLPVDSTSAVSTGIGAVGTAVTGVVWLGSPSRPAGWFHCCRFFVAPWA